ncbi:MAG TPA: tetratricopeptide repeat protein, partial [Thermoanaerobaculia bacterium]|nr:tetratricopeptide repeat protein [Thermoanaerobaculia bacterium]
EAAPEEAVEVPEPDPASAPPPLPLPATAPARRRGWIGLALIAAGLALAVALWLGWNRGTPETPAPSEDDGTRIVILPFENMGKPEDAYFADGLTEEITKDLAAFPSLQVISRTTAITFEREGQTLQDFGRKIRADYVLEGTVRWAPGPGGRARVRITPQLIRVEDDTHIWAGSYDREVEDIFAVQAEISRRVIGELGITLMPEEKREPRQPPTKNLEAYRAYLRGLTLRNQPFYSEEHIRTALPMFERAVALDPDFAAAWAELSQTHSYLAYNADPSPVRVEKARTSLERATALDPDLPEVRLARAYFTYRCLEDFEAAETQLRAAARVSPNDPSVLQTLGYVLRRRGRMTEALDHLERASSLDPLTVRLLWAIAETHQALRDYEQADRYYGLAISMAPDQAAYWEGRALNRLEQTGDPDEAREVLAESPIRDQPKLSSAFFLLDLYDRDYESALARLTPENRRALVPQLESRIITLGVITQDRLGDHAGARAMAEANRARLEALVRSYPIDPFYRAYLAVALAQLGRRDEARRHIDEAIRMTRNDAFSGPRMVEIQAMVEVVLGQHREAVERLRGLLAKPYQDPLSISDLRLSPIWDPLRDDPGFRNLLRDR